MFVWSFRMSKRELVIIIIGVAAFIITALLLLLPSGDRETSSLADSGHSLEADGSSQRLEFLEQFGWQCEPEPVEVKEVIIPAKFNDTYAEYNELQKQQGFDLQQYSGRRVKLWTYTVTNYPGGISDVVANLLILNGTVIGGDISSTLLDGFVHGFDPTQFPAQTALAYMTASGTPRTVPENIPTNTELPPEEDE